MSGELAAFYLPLAPMAEGTAESNTSQVNTCELHHWALWWMWPIGSPCLWLLMIVPEHHTVIIYNQLHLPARSDTSGGSAAHSLHLLGSETPHLLCSNLSQLLNTCAASGCYCWQRGWVWVGGMSSSYFRFTGHWGHKAGFLTFWNSFVKPLRGCSINLNI